MNIPLSILKNLRFSGVLLISIFCIFSSYSAPIYDLIPYPQELKPQSGKFILNKKTVILCPFDQPQIVEIAQQFSDHLALVAGIKLPLRDCQTTSTNKNFILFNTGSLTNKNPEAYTLKVFTSSVQITGNTAAGVFYGLQTLYQLFPCEVYASKESKKIKKWSVPCVEITDFPRFNYRGLHLDVCRHFFPVDFIKKYIDLMAIYKFNYFHWHLTDDQGWRIEIKKYPRLIEIGSKRDETLVGHYYESFPQQFDGKPYGGYYTQEEAKEIVAYAKKRGITVIPEIEMPGHAQAAIASYPFLSCTQDTTIKVATKWGIFKEVFCTRDTVFGFLEDVLSEIMEIFPSKYIHIGGDECPKDRWKECPYCQSLIKKLNLKDEHQLQSYFTQRIEKFINEHGRQIIGWDEILEGGLAPNATVMSWRGKIGGIEAARLSHDVIMTPTEYCYLDYYQADPEFEPLAIGGFVPLSKVYNFEPIPDELTPAEAKYILGAQANLWTEYILDEKHVEYMAYPRATALSEVVWSNKESKNWENFKERLSTHFQRFEKLGVNASHAFYEPQFNAQVTENNKLKITLSCDHPKAKIYFSLNGKEPDQHYLKPLIIDSTTIVSVATFVDGKKASRTLQKTFIVSKLTNLICQPDSNVSYHQQSIFKLTDGKLGNIKTTSEWARLISNEDYLLNIDLQKNQIIQRFTMGILKAPAFCGQIPSEIILYGSKDGINYQPLGEQKFSSSFTGKYEIMRPVFNFPPVEVRYLKIMLKNPRFCIESLENEKNNSVFIDEIAVW